jgi:pyrimidine-nucleoside phosphorylase
LFLAAEVIKKKRNGFSLSKEEIGTLIKKYTSGEIPDYQMTRDEVSQVARI